MIRSSLADEPSWVAMTSPLAGVTPAEAYGALEGAAVFWEKPLANESVAGFGEVDCRDTSPTDRPFEILDELAALTLPGRVTWLGDLGNQRPLGPWFGGFAFDQRRGPTSLWKAFPSGRWILPELLIWSRGAGLFATAFCGTSSGLRDAEKRARGRLAAAEEKLRNRLRRKEKPGRAIAVSSNRDAWDRLVGKALAAIDAGSMSKVVLARKITAQSDQPFDPSAAVARLCRMVPECTVFALRGADATTFIGATPEKLCKVAGRMLESEAIAGSAPGGSEPPLAPGDKEAREHRAVVDGIEEALRPLCSELFTDTVPGVVRLPHVRHLRTAIRGRLRAEVGLSRLVCALHPTPAVGGVPRDRAMEFLAEHEGLDRGWYAGPIGWIGGGAAELAVAIRSALIRGRQAELFVGAGIVAGSTAEGEWLETEAKSLTLLEAIGAGFGAR